MIDNKEHYIQRNITSHDVTLVTAYFNLGMFQKGPGATNVFTPDMYKKWMEIFKKVKFEFMFASCFTSIFSFYFIYFIFFPAQK